jgi:hypothetical protein
MGGAHDDALRPSFKHQLHPGLVFDGYRVDAWKARFSPELEKIVFDFILSSFDKVLHDVLSLEGDNRLIIPQPL